MKSLFDWHVLHDTLLYTVSLLELSQVSHIALLLSITPYEYTYRMRTRTIFNMCQTLLLLGEYP